MPRNLSHALEELGRLAAEVRSGTRESPWRFRDEEAAWEFRTEIVSVNIRANLWKMTEQLKVVEAFLDRGAVTHRSLK